MRNWWRCVRQLVKAVIHRHDNRSCSLFQEELSFCHGSWVVGATTIVIDRSTNEHRYSTRASSSYFSTKLYEVRVVRTTQAHHEFKTLWTLIQSRWLFSAWLRSIDSIQLSPISSSTMISAHRTVDHFDIEDVYQILVWNVVWQWLGWPVSSKSR